MKQHFVLQKKTITFGNYIYQVRNITYVGVEEYRTIQKPPFFIFLSLLVAGILWFLHPNYFVRTFGFFMIVIGIFGLLQGDRIYKEYGLIFETNSGGVEIFVSKDKSFLKTVVDKFYEIMDGETEKEYTINIEDKSIKVSGSIGGSINSHSNTGDCSSNVQGDVRGDLKVKIHN